MPYFIWEDSPACDGWAVVKANGDQIGCFKTKDDAIAQMVAVSLAENIEPGGDFKRITDGPRVIICDIDGTLIWHGERNDAVYEYATNQDAKLFIVTGRLETDRANTEAELADLNIEYDRLIMNPNPSVKSVDYKRATAKKLTEEFKIVAAIENNPDTLNAYRGLGIKAVSPFDIAPKPATNNRHAVELNKGKAMEQRHFSQNVTGLEIRADGDGRTFRGYAALFDRDSEPMGGFVERIAPGAFRRSLTSHGWDIKLLANHDAGRVLGSTRAKTLKLWEDSLGLWVEGYLPNSPDGDNIAEAVRRGDIDAMSFGFSVQPGGEAWSADGKVRTLTDVKLFEVSIVAWPAYSSTIGTTSVRSLEQMITRDDVSAEDLKVAIDAFVAGQDLTTNQGDLLKGVIDMLVQAESTDTQQGCDQCPDCPNCNPQDGNPQDGGDMPDTGDTQDGGDSPDYLPTEVLLHQLQMKLKGF